MQTNRYMAAGAAVVVVMALTWAVATQFLRLEGTRLWVLVSALTILSMIASALIVWYKSSKQAVGSASPAASESGAAVLADAAGSSSLATLIKGAESRLSGSKLAACLGDLPLFFVIGESGSAKTSTLLHSGLELDLLAGYTGSDAAPESTKLANIWVARGMIFAEAGGAVLSNAAQWREFVRRLAPRRLKSVVGGKATAPRAAIVCVDCEVFVQQGARAAAQALSRRLHDRLGEISDILGINFPVYVLFTRTDQVSHFVDYVHYFDKNEAAELLGAAFPALGSASTYEHEQTSRVQAAFDDLFHVLAAGRPEYLHRAHALEERPGVYEFPREFRKFTGKAGETGVPLAVEFLVELFKPSALRESPFLRGFYFSGVRPVIETDVAAKPVRSPAMGREASAAYGATSIFKTANAPESMSAPRFDSAPAGRKVPQWVFLKQLFNEVLPNDRIGIGASVASSKTAFLQRLLLGIAAGLCLLWLVALVVSWSGNRALQSEVSSAAASFPQKPLEPPAVPSPDQLAVMDRLQITLNTLADYRKGNSPLSLHWGLYSANGLYAPARTIYFSRLFHPLLFSSTQAALLAKLRALPPKPAPEDKFQPVYAALKAYLMTTSEWRRSAAETQWLGATLFSVWQRDHMEAQDTTGAVKRQFDFYAQQLGTENPFNASHDQSAVAQARGYLYEFNDLDLAYSQKLSEARAGATPINFQQLYPGQSSVSDRVVVDAAFTKAGWAAMQEALRKTSGAGEDWVLGPPPPGRTVNPSQLARELRAKYVAEYIEAWRDFVRGASIVPYAKGSLDDVSRKLAVTASGNQSPLLGLLGLVSENTSVDREVAEQFQPSTTVTPAGARGQFMGPSNKPYMDALVALQVAIDGALKGGPPAVDSAKTAATNARMAATQLANNFAVDRTARLNEAVKKLLLDPIEGADRALGATSTGPINTAGGALCGEWHALAGKSPFNPASSVPASIEEVNHFFQPGTGTLWTVYKQTFEPMMPLVGTTYTAQQTGSVRLTPAFVSFFNRAAAFANAAYPPTGGGPRLNFTLSGRPTQGGIEATITIDGQSLTVTPSSGGTQQFKWPAQQVGFKSNVVDAQSWSGVWSVFNLFATAEGQQWTKNGATYGVEWKLSKARLGKITASQLGTLRLDVNMNGAPPVFEPGYFGGMRCPVPVAQ